MRKSRRVFTSYKRLETAGVAHQLFDRVIKNGFAPFLDSYSIRPADNFQEELFHRMTDCDVLIQLHSPSFFESDRDRQEVEEANLKQIGTIAILWPESKLSSHSHLCIPITLYTYGFKNEQIGDTSTLIECIINCIISHVKSIRARNLAARYDSIFGEFIAEAKKISQKYFSSI